MDPFKNILDQSNPSACFICAINKNVCIISEDSEEANVISRLLKVESYQKIRYVCIQCFNKFKEICQFIHIAESNIMDNKLNTCKICLRSEEILSFPPHLLDVFRSILNGEVKCNYHPEYICHQCLIKLEDISNFINIVNSNKKTINYTTHVKTEFMYDVATEPISKNKGISEKMPNDVEIKEEPLQNEEDDVFDEMDMLLKHSTIKNEELPVMFESNNNVVKTEEVEINKHEESTTTDESYLNSLLKCEVEDPGLQYNYDEIIPIDCSICNRSFRTTRDLITHLKQRSRCRRQVPLVAQFWKSFIQKAIKPFKCLVCFKYFSTAKLKTHHIKQHFKASCVICPVCGKLFTKEKEYYKHFQCHQTKQMPIKCRICPRKFPTKLIYMKHLTKHKKLSKKKQYPCQRCKQPLSSKIYLRIHLNKTVKCPYCDQVFCRKRQLEVHLRSHSERPRYHCADCPRFFHNKGNLAKHCTIHTGYKPYVCKICQKCFSRSDYLRRHYKCIHNYDVERQRKRQHRKQTENKPVINSKGKSGIKEESGIVFICDICDKAFTSKTSLSSHGRVHNNSKSIQCTVCEKLFSYKGLLNSHMKIHLGYKPFVCTMCPRTFIKRNDLTRHTYTHTKEKNFRCEICFQSFARKDVLRNHVRNHAGQNPTKKKERDFQCDYCPKAYTSKPSLMNHLNRCKGVNY